MSAAYVASAFGAAMLVGVLPIVCAWGLACLTDPVRRPTPRHASGRAGARERRPFAVDDRSVPSGRPSCAPSPITATELEGLYPR